MAFSIHPMMLFSSRPCFLGFLENQSSAQSSDAPRAQGSCNSSMSATMSHVRWKLSTNCWVSDLQATQPAQGGPR